MATVTRIKLSASTQGRPIGISATAGSTATGGIVHQGPSSSAIIDELFLYAQVQGSATAGGVLTLEWGASGSASILEVFVGVGTGPQLIAPGLAIPGNSTPNEILAYTKGGADRISLLGYANRIDQS